MREFLKELGITLPGYEDADMKYVVQIPDSNEYSKVFSRLDNNNHIHELQNEDEKINFDKISYESESYLIDLFSDYENDKYWLECYRKEELL